MKDSLANVLLPSDALDGVTFRVGTVTDASGTIEVAIGGGDSLTAAYLDSYTPAIDDVVLILQTKADLIIVGSITSGG